MNNRLFVHIGRLHGVYPEAPSARRNQDLGILPCIENAWLLIKEGMVDSFGSMDSLPPLDGLTAAWELEEIIDLANREVIPGFVDSHTHLVFAATREEEFQMRLMGKTYEEIAAAGGGILNSARKLQATPIEQLVESAATRMLDMIYQGVLAFEVKSGYGLTLEAELKMLEVVEQLRQHFPMIPIRSTFLGAHAVPKDVSKDTYIDRLVTEWIPEVARQELADYCDVFCDKGYFTEQEAVRILTAGSEYGLLPRIHANELANSGGVQAAIATDCLSADHLEQITDYEIGLLQQSEVIPTALPGCSYFLGIPYAPARKMIAAGLPLAIASDFNPGTSPSGNPASMMSLACTQMKLQVAEAFNAMTINTAHALDLDTLCGSFFPGALGHFIVLYPGLNPAHIAYQLGGPTYGEIYLGGVKGV